MFFTLMHQDIALSEFHALCLCVQDGFSDDFTTLKVYYGTKQLVYVCLYILACVDLCLLQP